MRYIIFSIKLTLPLMYNRRKFQYIQGRI